MAGRPSKRTAETTQEIIDGIELGLTPEVAAGAAGVGRSTFYEWLQADEDFRTSVARARDVAEASLLRAVKAGDEKGESFGQAKAALEILSRSRPNRWAQRVNVKVEEELTLLLDVAERVLARPDYLRLLEALEESRNDRDMVIPPGVIPAEH